jgi:ABC-2 type transport system permease protein
MIDISRRVYLEGAGVDQLTSDLWPLALTAVLTLSTGAWVFRRRLA